MAVPAGDVAAAAQPHPQPILCPTSANKQHAKAHLNMNATHTNAEEMTEKEKEKEALRSAEDVAVETIDAPRHVDAYCLLFPSSSGPLRP